MRGIGHDRWKARASACLLTGNQANRLCIDRRARPERVHGDPVAAKLLRHAEHAQRHAVLRHRVGDVRAEPPRAQRRMQRRRDVEDVRVLPTSSDAESPFACSMNVPRVLIWCIRSKRFIGVSMVPVRLIADALLTRYRCRRNDRQRRRSPHRPALHHECRVATASALPPARSKSGAAV